MHKLGRKRPYELNDSDKLVFFLCRMTDLIKRKYYKEFKWTLPIEERQVLVQSMVRVRPTHLLNLRPGIHTC